MLPPSPISTLFPYTTLFRSCCTELFCLPLHTFALHHVADLSVVDAHGKSIHPDRPLPVDQELAEVVVDSENTEYASEEVDRKSTRLNSSHTVISYAVFCLKK